jgi:phosphoserine phosphatase
VSGGFTFFADRVAARSVRSGDFQSAADRNGSSRAPSTADRRRGRENVRPLLDGRAERSDAADTLAIGDGSQLTIPKLEAAGLGVAYRAKPAVAAAAGARIEHGYLTALLYAQGYARSEWA